MSQPVVFGNENFNLNKFEEIIYVKNTSGASIAAGAVVCYDVATDDNMTSVILPSAANIEMVAGILLDTLADDAVGRCMRRGYYNSTFVLGHVSLGQGDRLKAVAGQRYLTYDAEAAAGPTPAAFVAREAYTTAAEAAKKVYINL